ncbi:triple QxxK/R motif-containing protein isoform X2 [Callorhinus ursinus]|uniref:triple QxxK/R motif-containing protein isoform X2 n=1 Tax=Callorhinus ursinus TaxID=34884 RepID=UPI003CD01699
MDGYSSHLTTVLCCDESMNTKLSSRGETAFESDCVGLMEGFLRKQAFWRSKMGRKDASTIKLPVDQYRKQIGKQDYKKTKPILRATKLKAEAKKTAIGIKTSVVLCAPGLRTTMHCSRHVYMQKRTACDNSGSTLATCLFPELPRNVLKTNTTVEPTFGTYNRKKTKESSQSR